MYTRSTRNGIEIEPPRENGEQEIGNQDKLLTSTFQIEIENRKVEGLITYSTDQQIFKFKVNSWGVNIEFTLYELKCTIHAILQHMGFYHTTENPCVMMRAKHNTKSCECIIIHQDELYIASTVNLTENDAKSLSKAPCLVALNMYLTLHLLLFG